MPYRVEVSEPLIRSLQSKLRTRVWLALAQVAQVVDKAPAAPKQPPSAIPLGEGYSASYRVDVGTRTVSLLEIQLSMEPPPPPH